MTRSVSQGRQTKGRGLLAGRLQKVKTPARTLAVRDARRNVVRHLLYARSNRLSRKKSESNFMTLPGSTWDDRSDATDIAAWFLSPRRYDRLHVTIWAGTCADGGFPAIVRKPASV